LLHAPARAQLDFFEQHGLRDGWPGLNSLTSATPVLPAAAVDGYGFCAARATFDAQVEVVALAVGGASRCT
jgi:hypothetical protein